MTKAYTPNDKFFYLAKQQGFRARSAFKLLEIQDKFKIIKAGQKILDLGAFPGSWLQVCKKLNPRWDIIWLDLEPISDIPWISTYVCDVFSPKIDELLHGQVFDLILSDMAPNTSGISDVDQYKSVEINLEALEIMKKYLRKGWSGVFKVFRGADFNDFWDEAKLVFSQIKTFKPDACRDRSFEIYCVGKMKNDA